MMKRINVVEMAKQTAATMFLLLVAGFITLGFFMVLFWIMSV